MRAPMAAALATVVGPSLAFNRTVAPIFDALQLALGEGMSSEIRVSDKRREV